jgi:hypothetical protein
VDYLLFEGAVACDRAVSVPARWVEGDFPGCFRHHEGEQAWGATTNGVRLRARIVSGCTPTYRICSGVIELDHTDTRPGAANSTELAGRARGGAFVVESAKQNSG